MIGFAIKSIYVSAGKHEFIMAAHLYGYVRKHLIASVISTFFLGMIGSSAGWYADALLPTLS